MPPFCEYVYLYVYVCIYICIFVYLYRYLCIFVYLSGLPINMYGHLKVLLDFGWNEKAADRNLKPGGVSGASRSLI